jgi:hypothetical protein
LIRSEYNLKLIMKTACLYAAAAVAVQANIITDVKEFIKSVPFARSDVRAYVGE